MSNSAAPSAGQWLLRRLVSGGERRFRREAGNLETVQRRKLSRLLRQVANTPTGRRLGVDAHWRWEDFASRMPVTDYESWRGEILQQRREGGARLTRSPVRRYQPTSGSSAAMKWIPYSQAFLDELDAAICPWVADLYRQWPGLRRGRHYWSMSWVPTELRQQISGDVNDDMKLMSPGKRLLAGMTQAVPQQVSLTDSSDDSLFASLAFLVARSDLSLMSVWSPTFGLGLLEALSGWRDEVASVLRTGDWGDRAARMAGLKAPWSRRGAEFLEAWDGTLRASFFRELWPELALVSAWDTAASRPWAHKLQEFLPQAELQGKGLWATEGVVTIPYGEHYALAYQSHVYEFEDVQDGRILAPWQLRTGQEVMPLLSTGSGLLRYAMKDLVCVEGFMNTVPSLRFLGRNDGTDMVGEKLSVALIQDVLDELDCNNLIRPVSLVGLSDAGDGKPGYWLLTEPVHEGTMESIRPQLQATGRAMENRLLHHFHYRLARDLEQLAPVRCLCHSRMREIYLRQCRDRGMIEGNIKVEALQYWGDDLPEALSGLASLPDDAELCVETP